MMKKTIILLCCTAALITGLTGCRQEIPETPEEVADLRYRVQDSYDLPATGAKAFNIVVVSSKPWTITSEHPDWCIISDEEGAAADPETVHVGKAEPVTVRVQYYDNTLLDDRTDKIFIESGGWVGKTVTVRQKGCAFLSIPEEDLAVEVAKAGGSHAIRISSNQDWTARVTDGEWLSIPEGASGNGEGSVTVVAAENTAELRYGEVTVYDRNNKESALIKFTQDGVQLVPLSTEIRAGFDQASGELEILSNTKWKLEKVSESDSWFTLDPTTGECNGKVTITFTRNTESMLRKARLRLSNIVEHESDFVAQKIITVKQANEIVPTRVILNSEELDLWKSDWDNKPAYTKDVGTLFTARARLNRTMAFGTYTFHWSQIQGSPEGAGARVRHWFCFSEGAELKADIRPADGKVSYDFNAANDGNKPSVSSFTDLDFSQPVEVTYKFDPSGAEYCHVTYLVNGKVAGSFDTSETLLRTVKWGESINMYIGVDEAGSAICEWYEFTAPMDWGD